LHIEYIIAQSSEKYYPPETVFSKNRGCKKSPDRKKAEKYKKKSNGLKDKQNDSKQQFLCFSIK